MEVPPWKTVHCPTSVRFSSIRKELFCCRGRFYVAYVPEAQELIWIGQSMKALADHISESQRYGKFHVSCAYRFLRGQYVRNRYGKFMSKRPATVQEVNEAIEESGARGVVAVIRDPDNWQVLPETLDKCSHSTSSSTSSSSRPPSPSEPGPGAATAA
jgi:hypothetical protein